MAIGGFVVAVIVPALAVGLLLADSGSRWPATAGNATAAVLLVVGGPLLARRLRTIMNRRTAGFARG